ncbi:MAG TPA: DUF4259 domain-containing protein [Longimicrobium sp.]|nr:DUF4259 domain-containing protein [Longimicrobium sp.]
MGAWGTGVFDNDAALDWFDALEQRGADAVLVALQTIPEEADTIEVDQANEALAAAEIVAACRARASSNLPGEATDWINAHETEIGPELLPLAIDAVTRIRAESELKDLWEEGDSAAEWLAVIDDLLGRLREGGSGESQ